MHDVVVNVDPEKQKMVILSPRAFNMRLTTVVGILGTFKAFKIFLTAFQDVPRCGKKRKIR